MSAALEVRRATAGDLDAIAGFARTVVHDVYDSMVGPEYAATLLREYWSSMLADAVGQGLVHLAWSGGDLVGLVEQGLIDGEPVIWKLYVSPDRRGAGIGPRLIQAAVAAAGDGHERMLLEHIAANADAGRFYDREGFEVIRVDRGESGALDVVWRARKLS